MRLKKFQAALDDVKQLLPLLDSAGWDDCQQVCEMGGTEVDQRCSLK